VDQSLLGSGEVYVVQRSFTSFDGIAESATTLGGHLESDNEQVDASMSCEDIQDLRQDLFGF
jgi:hypothetical protein